MYGQVRDSSWHAFSFGSPELTIFLPRIPEPLETMVQPSMLEIIQSFYGYGCEDRPTDTGVMLFHIGYAAEIRPDFSILGDQTIRELEIRGASYIKYTTASIRIGNRKGIRQSGSLEFKGIPKEFSATILTEGSKVWKIIIYIEAGDQKGQQMEKAILDSIAFKEK